MTGRIPPAQGWSKSLEDCHEAIINAYAPVCEEFVRCFPACDLQVDYTYRGKDLQFELFKKGRELQNGAWIVVDKSKVVTDKDGSQPSHHQTYPAQAADIYIREKGKILWPPDAHNDTAEASRVRSLYIKLGTLWMAHGLIAGANWKYSWKDLPHVQVAYSIIGEA